MFNPLFQMTKMSKALYRMAQSAKRIAFLKIKFTLCAMLYALCDFKSEIRN